MKIQFLPVSTSYHLQDNSCTIRLYGRYIDSSKKSNTTPKICVLMHFKPYFFINLNGANYQKLTSFLQDKLIYSKYSSNTSKAAGHSIGTDKVLGTVLSFEKCIKKYLGEDKEFLQVFVDNPKSIYHLASELSKKGLEILEADIHVSQRFLVDHNLTMLEPCTIEGEFKDLKNFKFRTPTFLATSIKPLISKKTNSSKNNSSKTNPSKTNTSKPNLTPLLFSTENIKQNVPKVLAIDIETYNERMELDMENNPILMIALYGKNKTKTFQKVLTYKKIKNKSNKISDLTYLEICKDEADMLEKFQQHVLSFNPDFLCTYFGDGFDFPYIKRRSEILGVKLDLAADFSSINCTGKTSKKALIEGLPHLDLFKFIRYILGVYWKIDSFSLDNVAKKLLNEKKIDVDLNKLSSAWNSGKGLEPYVIYNLHDAKITWQIYKQVFLSIKEFCHIVGISPDDLIRMRFSRLVENFLLKKAISKKILQPNKPTNDQISNRMQRHVQGAFVFEPTPGIYQDVIIFDFLSLYPTIIISHNIGKETIFSNKKNKTLPITKNLASKKTVPVPGRPYLIRTDKPSFISQVLGEIVDKRSQLKKELRTAKKSTSKNTDSTSQKVQMLKTRLDSLKVLANSFYGYFGFYGARWYSFEGADSITAFARHYIKDLISKATKSKFEVIYSDTDSIMITLKDKTKKEAHDFVDKVNSKLPGAMELEYEGYFPRAIFVASKASENKAKQKGAKKKYALIDENNELKIVGFETVRRNWSKIAKVVQKEFLSLVLKGEEQKGLTYLRKIVTKVKDHKIDVGDLIIKTQLKQSPENYKSIGPHVAIAKRMQEEGILVKQGTLIEYVVQTGSGLVRDRARRVSKLTQKYDSKYYLEKQILPAVEPILAVLSFSKKDILTGSKQSGLTGFI